MDLSIPVTSEFNFFTPTKHSDYLLISTDIMTLHFAELEGLHTLLQTLSATTQTIYFLDTTAGSTASKRRNICLQHMGISKYKLSERPSSTERLQNAEGNKVTHTESVYKHTHKNLPHKKHKQETRQSMKNALLPLSLILHLLQTGTREESESRVKQFKHLRKQEGSAAQQCPEQQHEAN